MAIVLVGLTSPYMLPPTPTRADLVWRTMPCGLSFGMFYSPTPPDIAAASIDRSACAGAPTTTTRGTGPTRGATATAALFAAGFGDDGLPMLVAAGLAMLAAVCSVVASEVHENMHEREGS